jgi:hypothetical protein
MMTQLRRYQRHMFMLIIVGILLTVVSRMGSTPSNGFLIWGIVCIALGIGLYTMVLMSGRKR